MQNGTYLVQSKSQFIEYKLVAYNGSMKLYDKHRGSFIRTVNEDYVKEFYDVKGKVPGAQNNYDIAWMREGKMVKRIVMQAGYGVCKWKIGELSRMRDYRGGLLIPVRCNANL